MKGDVLHMSKCLLDYNGKSIIPGDTIKRDNIITGEIMLLRVEME